ncbi:MAG TPA: FUSC family protein, partial [Candidatus Methylacidiphilales bacterium]
AAGAHAALPIFIHRLRETLAALAAAARGWDDWRSGRDLDPALRARLDTHRDVRGAVRTGLYAVAAVLGASIFWIATAWPSGAAMVTFAAIACCLAWTQKAPEKFVRAFLVGAVLSIPICAFLVFGCMAKVEGFVPLAVILGVPVFVGALAAASPAPAVAGIGVIFLTLIMTLTAPRNPMSYDFGGYLENAAATVVGILFAWVCALLLRTPDPRRRAGRLIRTVCGEVEALAAAPLRELPPRPVWESRVYDRLLGSMPHLEDRAEEIEVLDSAFAAVQIGASVIDLRRLAASEEEAAPRWREIVHRALDRLRFLGTRAGEAAEAARHAAALLLADLPPGRDESGEKLFRVRSAASLEGIWLLASDEEEVFHRVKREAVAEGNGIGIGS